MAAGRRATRFTGKWTNGRVQRCPGGANHENRTKEADMYIGLGTALLILILLVILL